MSVRLDKSTSGKTNTTYKGQKLGRLFFNSTEPLSTDDVKQCVTTLSKQYKDMGIKGQFCVSCLYPFGWRSGEVFTIGEDARVYDPTEWYTGENVEFDETCTRFAVYVLGATKPEGGCNAYNDCLFQCIRQVYGNQDNMPPAINRPWKLKKLLSLGRNDKVPLDKLPIIEEHMPKCSITVYGDYEYISTKQAPMNIRLRLANEHYTVVNNENRTRTANARNKPVKKENVYSYQTKPTCKIYNGEEQDCTREELRTMMENYDYIMISVKAGQSLKEARDKYTTFADDILRVTDNKVNLYKYPTTAIASMDMFRYMSKMLKEPEHIDAIEGSILAKAFQGGLTYANKGYKGFGITYDVNSMYPSMMVDHYLQFPMAAGEPTTLTDADLNDSKQAKYFKYGIYRAIVQKSGEINVDKFFKFNGDNHYTHFDLLLATELGLEFHLIQDGQFNFYYYHRSKLVSSQTIFSNYIEFFYKLKQEYKPAKELLSCLWGALCQKEDRELYLKHNMEFSINAGLQITSIKPGNDDAMRIRYQNPDIIYKTDYARIGPFLTSYARLKLVRQIKPYASHIVRIHTDSFTLDENLPVIVKVGTLMGQYKVEYSGQIEIEHINKIIKSCHTPSPVLGPSPLDLL